MFVYVPTEGNLQQIANECPKLRHVVAICGPDSATFQHCDNESLATEYVGALARRGINAFPYDLNNYRR